MKPLNADRRIGRFFIVSKNEEFQHEVRIYYKNIKY